MRGHIISFGPWVIHYRYTYLIPTASAPLASTTTSHRHSDVWKLKDEICIRLISLLLTAVAHTAETYPNGNVHQQVYFST
jgi:hypothetical protein